MFGGHSYFLFPTYLKVSIRWTLHLENMLCMVPGVYGSPGLGGLLDVFLLFACPFEDAICEHLGQKPWSRMPPPDTELYALDQRKRQKADEKKCTWNETHLDAAQNSAHIIQHHFVLFLFGWSISALVWILLVVRARSTYTTNGDLGDTWETSVMWWSHQILDPSRGWL